MSRRWASGAGLLVIVLWLVGVATFAESIGLPRPVPSFNQAYTDGAGAWGRSTLGSGGCPDTIAESGCLLTAFASVLAYFDIGVEVSASASATGRSRTGMDPGILNDWLRAHDGYGRCSQDPVGACCLAWDRLPGVDVTFHTNRSEVGVNPVSAVVIDHALRQGEPVIAGVHWGANCRSGSSQSEDCHWVVLTGKIGDRYTILDPYNPDPADSAAVRTTLDAGVKGSYVIDRFVVVTRSSESIDGTNPIPEDQAQATSAGGLLVLLAALIVVGAIVIAVTALAP